ncbi:MAG: hypothetical protein FJ104_04265 [Deltaproteobacteria bacterium]|nr:hypothetical protein [Deltaproteobacteria bacterium]
MTALRAAAFPVLLALTACAGAGPYGHAPRYAPLPEEETALDGGVEFDPVMAARAPEKWKNLRVHAFGVVKARRAGAAGRANVTLSLRTLAPRNLCDSSDDSSCRVTVGDHEHSLLHAELTLRPEDERGAESLGIGSLVRVVGALADGPDATDGAPVIQATYYRHWPRGFFLTSRDAATVRR